MDLKYDDLQAFIETHRQGSFTKASQALGISQPALSQKLARLEEALQAAVFIRHPRSLELTPSGEKLLIYAKQALQMQMDFLSGFDQYQSEIAGVIRVAGFSSVMRSMIIPALVPFLRKHPKARIEFSVHEMFELEGILKSNKADFIVTDYLPSLAQTESEQIAQEEYVIIESKRHKNVPNVFLDHGPQDNATESYFRHVGKELKYERAYMGDVYSIIDGVAMGLGRAVMSKHLVEGDGRFRILEHRKRYIRPVALTYLSQSYYGPLHQAALEILRT